eukprot:TRINITY_DN54434_c0_g1_i1.p2 TRINITY_DN54434_c0_g1~~TRINITY_DN54434_c0_g1_i1.p2  ORF type:complete len:195 (-),score=26.92 TRINITY_DN54434_c0_g1_i1:183-767(-)
MCIRDRYQRRVRGIKIWWRMGNRCQNGSADDPMPGQAAVPKRSVVTLTPIQQNRALGVCGICDSNRSSQAVCEVCSMGMCRKCRGQNGRCVRCVLFVLYPRSAVQLECPRARRNELYELQRQLIGMHRKERGWLELKERVQELDQEIQRAEGLARVSKEHFRVILDTWTSRVREDRQECSTARPQRKLRRVLNR